MILVYWFIFGLRYILGFFAFIDRIGQEVKWDREEGWDQERSMSRERNACRHATHKAIGPTFFIYYI